MKSPAPTITYTSLWDDVARTHLPAMAELADLAARLEASGAGEDAMVARRAVLHGQSMLNSIVKMLQALDDTLGAPGAE
jgi:hypothetical protein